MTVERLKDFHNDALDYVWSMVGCNDIAYAETLVDVFHYSKEELIDELQFGCGYDDEYIASIIREIY